jgi:hypothetical protein
MVSLEGVKAQIVDSVRCENEAGACAEVVCVQQYACLAT